MHVVSFVSSFVLVTGASAGIGAEFARQYAAAGYSVVLSARSEQKLKLLARELVQKFGVEAEVLVADLLDHRDLTRVQARLEQVERPVEILVNNAGFGLGKSFDRAPLEKHLAQVDVLARAPLALMHTAIRAMLARGRGKIINVASVAAFTPGGTYAAAKRFVVAVSESAHLQYGGRGIAVTAVCPGLTRSDFHRNMGVSEPQLPAFLFLDPVQVVSEAIAANNRGRALVVPSLPYKILVALSRVLPRRLVGGIISRTRNY